MIEIAIISFLMGVVTGLIIHEKIFPEHKTVNEIAKIKKSSIEFRRTFDPTIEDDTEPKRKRNLFNRIFRRGKI